MTYIKNTPYSTQNKTIAERLRTERTHLLVKYNVQEECYRLIPRTHTSPIGRDNRLKKDWKKCTQEIFCDILTNDYGYHIDRTTYIKYETQYEKATYTIDFLIACCTVFDCDIGYLIGDYDEKKRQNVDMVKYLGLSECAIHNLQDMKNNIDLQQNALQLLADKFSVTVNEDWDYLDLMTHLLEHPRIVELFMEILIFWQKEGKEQKLWSPTIIHLLLDMQQDIIPYTKQHKFKQKRTRKS